MSEMTRTRIWNVRGLALLSAAVLFSGATVAVAENDPDARFRDQFPGSKT